MEGFLFGLLEVTLAMSLVIAALLLLGKWLNRRFAPQWRYWVWLVIALRLALPLNVSLPQAPVTVPVPPAAVRVEQPIRPAGPTEVYLNTTPAAWPQAEDLPRVEDIQQITGSGGAAMTRGERIPLPVLLFAVWAVGAAGFLTVQILSYVNFKRRVRRWSRPAGEYQGIPVVACDVVMSPILMGLFRPVIVVPAGGASEYALLHEATHAQRRDLWYKLLLVLANAVHWFNPLVWAMGRAAERDVEIACDGAVLAGKDENYRRAYGQALLDTVTAGRKPAAALTSAFSGSKKSLKQRFASLLDMAPKHPGRAALALVCAAALLGGSLVACRREESAAELEQFTPEQLTALYLGPQDGDEEEINWYALVLHFHGGTEGDEDWSRLTYRLEFLENSSMLELMGVTPFQATEPPVLGEAWTLTFRTGRNSVTEAVMRGLVAEDPTCTLVVEDPETAESRTFPMKVQWDNLGEGENTVTLPAGQTILAIGGVEGTAGGFQLEVSPAERIAIQG